MPVAARPAWIRKQRPVALTRQHLKLRKEHVAVVRVRAAVNREHQWVALARLIAVRLHQPAFDLQAADAGEPERVGGNHGDLLQERIVERCEPAVRPASERSHIQLGAMRDVAGRVGERPPVCTEREAAQLALSRCHLTNWATSDRHGKEVHVAVGLGAEVDRLAIGRPGGTAGVETPVHRRKVSGGASACRNDADVVLHLPAF